MIPGLVHGLMGGNRFTEIALDLIGVNANTNSNSVSYSHTPASGDLAVFLDMAYAPDTTTPPAEIIPSGYTKFVGESTGFTAGGASNGGRITGSYRICDGTEGSSVSGMSGGIVRGKHLALFRPDTPVLVGTPVVDIAKNPDDPNTLPVSLGAQPEAPVLLIAAYMYVLNESQTLTSSPSMATLNVSSNRFRSLWSYQMTPDELSSQSTESGTSRNNNLINTLSALPLIPL